jgi:Zn finger protein HypA/HybF involved in hydrogenase expression
MHDTLISKDIIETAKKQGKVKSITVEVGALGHVPLEELKETLKGLVDWNINMISKKAKVECVCGFVGAPNIIEHRHGHSVFFCPSCGSVPKVLEGEDIILKKVVVE